MVIAWWTVVLEGDVMYMCMYIWKRKDYCIDSVLRGVGVRSDNSVKGMVYSGIRRLILFFFFCIIFKFVFVSFFLILIFYFTSLFLLLTLFSSFSIFRFSFSIFYLSFFIFHFHFIFPSR